MSGEQITIKDLDKTSAEHSIKQNKPRVNINDLLTKVRQQKHKDKKENYIFLGLVVSVLVVTGDLASL